MNTVDANEIEDADADVDAFDAEAWHARAASSTLNEYASLIARVDSRHALLNAVTAARAAKRADAEAFGEAALAAALRRFPHAKDLRRAFGRYDPPEDEERFAESAVTAAAKVELDDAASQAWRAWLIAEGRRPVGQSEDIEQLARKVLDDEACRRILTDADLDDMQSMAMWSGGLLRAIATRSPDALVDTIHDRVRVEGVAGEKARCLSYILRETIASIGERVVSEAGVVTVEDDRGELHKMIRVLPTHLRRRIEGIRAADAALARIASSYNMRDGRLALRGASASVNEIANTQPEDWADYLRIALWRSSNDQAIVEPTLAAARKTARVAQVLREMIEDDTAPSPRDRARALLTTIEGSEAERPSREALVRLVELVGGPEVFPHPLQAPSSTWLCSLELEALLRGWIDQAAKRLARELPERLGRNEEKLTTRVLTTIQRSLEDAAMVGRESTRAGDAIDVACEYRELSKGQEKEDGADVGWVLEVDVPNAVRFTQAEFVQAKKAIVEDGKYLPKWVIDTDQLGRLLSRSQTAVYWLYAPDGTIHVVPARYLRAILDGEGRGAVEHGRVDIAHVRSVSISIAQFLIDLFVGGWIGTTRPEALAVATGDNQNDKPDLLFAVRVKGRHED